jgi:hypothetical protein
MFFKKRQRDSSLICKLAMKNPRAFEEMLAITNKYALTEEATLDNRDAKKDKESSQSDQSDTSKNNDKMRKHDRSLANVERSQHNRTEYRPYSVEFEGFLERISIFHLRGNTRLGTATDCKDLQMKS